MSVGEIKKATELVRSKISQAMRGADNALASVNEARVAVLIAITAMEQARDSVLASSEQAKEARSIGMDIFDAATDNDLILSGMGYLAAMQNNLAIATSSLLKAEELVRQGSAPLQVSETSLNAGAMGVGEIASRNFEQYLSRL